jgi:hypothetical protein
MPRPLFPGERAPGTHWIEGLVSPSTGLDDVEKRKFLTLRGLELCPLSRPALSQSLYRLRYSYLPLSVWDRYDFVTWGYTADVMQNSWFLLHLTRCSVI